MGPIRARFASEWAELKSHPRVGGFDFSKNLGPQVPSPAYLRFWGCSSDSGDVGDYGDLLTHSGPQAEFAKSANPGRIWLQAIRAAATGNRTSGSQTAGVQAFRASKLPTPLSVEPLQIAL